MFTLSLSNCTQYTTQTNTIEESNRRWRIHTYTTEHAWSCVLCCYVYNLCYHMENQSHVNANVCVCVYNVFLLPSFVRIYYKCFQTHFVVASARIDWKTATIRSSKMWSLCMFICLFISFFLFFLLFLQSYKIASAYAAKLKNTHTHTQYTQEETWREEKQNEREWIWKQQQTI